MTPDTPALDTKSSMPSSRWKQITYGFAIIGLISVLALASMALRVIGVIEWDLTKTLSDSDEAPIRVRNGSIEFTIVGFQGWEQIGSSANWRIANATRHREDFEVTLAVRAGATCGGALTATGSDIVVTYENDDDPATTNTSRIVLQAQGRRTVVRPEGPATLTPDGTSPWTLRYQAGAGFVKSIAVGNGANPAVICSFTGRDQLDHMLILNVP
jgi:hypothetical protein